MRRLILSYVDLCTDIQLILEANHYIYIGKRTFLLTANWCSLISTPLENQFLLVSRISITFSDATNAYLFSISNTVDKGPVKNLIAKALVERILSAARDGQKFKVVILIPEVPGFSGAIKDETSIKTIMAAQVHMTVRLRGQS